LESEALVITLEAGESWSDLCEKGSFLPLVGGFDMVWTAVVGQGGGSWPVLFVVLLLLPTH